MAIRTQLVLALYVRVWKKLLSNNQMLKPILRKTYNDVFIIWSHTHEKLQAFLIEFTTLQKNILFTVKYPHRQESIWISYLDI